MKIIDLTQQSDEWKAWRSTSYGASESAAILGESGFKTAYQLFLEKRGYVSGFDGNAATQAGKESEEKARAMYEMLHGDFEVFEPYCVEHEKYSFITASLDGYSENLKRIVEIKYPSQKSHEMALAGEVPRHYWIQIQHQLACCPEAINAHYWSFRESNGAVVEVRRDDAFINDILIPAVVAFKGLVDSNTPPPLTDKDAKWVDDKESLFLFEQIKTTEDKKIRSAIADEIIKLAGHPKVRLPSGLITSVLRDGVFSFYKITIKA